MKKSLFISLSYLSLTPIILGGCSNSPDNPAVISNRYVADQLHISPPAAPKIEDLGSQWHVVYLPPEGSVGGRIEVWIDKKSRKVVRDRNWQ